MITPNTRFNTDIADKPQMQVKRMLCAQPSGLDWGVEKHEKEISIINIYDSIISEFVPGGIALRQ